MVQASTSGAYDFHDFDPQNRWCWKRLRWVLARLDTDNQLQSLLLQHHHWVNIFTNSTLDETSFDTAKGNATELLREFLETRFPWDRDKYAGLAGGTLADAIDQFREAYGYPGDPRYEAMLADMMDAFKKLKE
jgi:hypothetical protein